MKVTSRPQVLTGILVLLFAGRAFADDEPTRLRLGGDLEFGMMASRSQAGRRDHAGLFSIPIRGYLQVSDRVQLSAGLGIPMPVPMMAIHLPLGLHWRLGSDARSGLAVNVGVRGLYATVDLCGEDASRCPLDEAVDDPQNRGAWVYGVTGDAGVSYTWALSDKLALRLAASYLAGQMWGRTRNAEAPVEGFYQGGVGSLGLVY